MVLIIFSWFTATQNRRSSLVHTILGFTDNSKTVVTGGFAIAETDRNYQLQIPFYNRESEDRQLTRVTFRVISNFDTRIRCLPGIEEYELSDRLAVYGDLSVGQARPVGGQVTSGSASLAATGSLIMRCKTVGLSMSFEPHIVLQSLTTTIVVIDVPKTLRASVEPLRPVEGEPKVTKGRLSAAMEIPLKAKTGASAELTRPESVVVVQLDAVTDNAVKISTCNELRGRSAVGDPICSDR